MLCKVVSWILNKMKVVRFRIVSLLSNCNELALCIKPLHRASKWKTWKINYLERQSNLREKNAEPGQRIEVHLKKKIKKIWKSLNSADYHGFLRFLDLEVVYISSVGLGCKILSSSAPNQEHTEFWKLIWERNQ